MAKSPAKAALTEPEALPMPSEGGSYLRQADGSLLRLAGPDVEAPQPAPANGIEAMSAGEPSTAMPEEQP